MAVWKTLSLYQYTAREFLFMGMDLIKFFKNFERKCMILFPVLFNLQKLRATSSILGGNWHQPSPTPGSPAPQAGEDKEDMDPELARLVFVISCQLLV